jgi:hypothetical protein
LPESAQRITPEKAHHCRAVIFKLSVHDREVEGAVARGALEEHFWLPSGADATRMLRTFENGRNASSRVAQRKLIARPDEPLWLTVSEFVTTIWLTMFLMARTDLRLIQRKARCSMPKPSQDVVMAAKCGCRVFGGAVQFREGRASHEITQDMSACRGIGEIVFSPCPCP